MTAKETFLKRMEEVIQTSETELKAIKEAYVQNKKLPDSFFENLQIFQPPPPTNGMSIMEVLSNAKVLDIEENKDESINDYGRNRRIVLEIIQKEGKGILKKDIVSRFEQITKLKDQGGVVTTAISALTLSKVLKGYKPEGAKFRGLFWTLKIWWDNEVLKDDYKPEPYNPIAKYL